MLRPEGIVVYVCVCVCVHMHTCVQLHESGYMTLIYGNLYRMGEILNIV